MSDRTVAPGARREQAAWRAGLRPSARWLVPGTGCLVLAAAIDTGASAAARRWGEWSGRAANNDDVFALLGVWVLILLVGAGGVLLVALAQRTVGAVGPRDSDLPAGVRTPVLATTALALAAVTVLAALVAPAAAGAARAVDASALGLVDLWANWATRLLGTSGALLLVAGVVEHLAMRRGLWRDLHMSRAQAREQSRQLGGR